MGERATREQVVDERRRASGLPQIHWPVGHIDVPVSDGAIDVWAANLDLSSAEIENYERTLAAAERERAKRFHFTVDRQRFITARGFLRALLGKYLGVDPATITFGYGSRGKPFLAGPLLNSRLWFNLAHSADLALVAISRTGPVGVDVEFIKPIPEVDQLVSHFFSSRESDAFAATPLDERSIAFFNLWTRKEAWLKAIGEGIAHSLSLVEVTFLPGEPARLLRLPGNSETSQRWYLHDLRPAKGFAGAVAALSGDTSVRCWRWNNEPG